MQSIYTTELRQGHILAHTVELSNGVRLKKLGSLNMHEISLLKQSSLVSVEIYSPEDVNKRVDLYNAVVVLLNRSISSMKIRGVNPKDCAYAQKIIQGTIAKNPVLLYNIYKLLLTHYTTYKHSVRVAILSVMLYRHLGNAYSYPLSDLTVGALLHDLGKQDATVKQLVDKRGKLSDFERGMIQSHPQLAFNYINKNYYNSNICSIILQHHEMLNGKGYPFGLKGSQINYLAQIVSVADVYDAVTQHRPYHLEKNNFRGYEVLNNDVESGALNGEIVRALKCVVAVYVAGDILDTSLGIQGRVSYTTSSKTPRIVLSDGRVLV
jgi:putative nucleotidyltransferase with HDIG domain